MNIPTQRFSSCQCLTLIGKVAGKDNPNLLLVFLPLVGANLINTVVKRSIQWSVATSPPFSPGDHRERQGQKETERGAQHSPFDQEIILCPPKPLFLVKPCAAEVGVLCSGGPEPQLASLSLSGTFDHSALCFLLVESFLLAPRVGRVILRVPCRRAAPRHSSVL